MRLRFLAQHSLFAAGTGTGSGFGGPDPLCAASRSPRTSGRLPNADILVGPGSLTKIFANLKKKKMKLVGYSRAQMMMILERPKNKHLVTLSL
jgi:hypothetical protein